MNRWLIIAVILAGLFTLSFRLTMGLIRPGGGDLSYGYEIAVPSGQTVWFLDRAQGVSGDAGQAGEGISARFRFVAPDLAESGQAFDLISGDMLHLCDVVRTVLSQEKQDNVAQIVIALADQETEAGSSDPDVRKYFEAFVVEGETCVAELF